MTPRIVVVSPHGQEVANFLRGHVAEMRAVSPPGSSHALDLDGLAAPGVILWAAYVGAELAGTAALARLEAEHAEIKSMRTSPSLRGHGVGQALVGQVLDSARKTGLRRLSLETGSQDHFAPARRLYGRHGFMECAPFGSYREDPASVFMTLELDARED